VVIAAALWPAVRRYQLVGWVAHFAKPIALVPSMMGIASVFALGARADAVAARAKVGDWHIFYGDIHAGTIAIRSVNPTDTAG
jgi:hypothetical protein